MTTRHFRLASTHRTLAHLLGLVLMVNNCRMRDVLVTRNDAPSAPLALVGGICGWQLHPGGGERGRCLWGNKSVWQIFPQAIADRGNGGCPAVGAKLHFSKILGTIRAACGWAGEALRFWVARGSPTLWAEFRVPKIPAVIVAGWIDAVH
jgi:hypothetical protein